MLFFIHLSIKFLKIPPVHSWGPPISFRLSFKTRPLSHVPHKNWLFLNRKEYNIFIKTELWVCLESNCRCRVGWGWVNDIRIILMRKCVFKYRYFCVLTFSGTERTCGEIELFIDLFTQASIRAHLTLVLERIRLRQFTLQTEPIFLLTSWRELAGSESAVSSVFQSAQKLWQIFLHQTLVRIAPYYIFDRNKNEAVRDRSTMRTKYLYCSLTSCQ